MDQANLFLRPPGDQDRHALRFSMAKAKPGARTAISEAEIALLNRLIDRDCIYVVSLTKAMRPRKVASASLTEGGRILLLYLSKMPAELPGA
jgi:hypothetical protein